jgi:hypothetical protein
MPLKNSPGKCKKAGDKESNETGLTVRKRMEIPVKIKKGQKSYNSDANREAKQ